MPVNVSAAASCPGCPYRVPVRGACGHPQHQALMQRFSDRPETTCPMFPTDRSNET